MNMIQMIYVQGCEDDLTYSVEYSMDLGELWKDTNIRHHVEKHRATPPLIVDKKIMHDIELPDNLVDKLRVATGRISLNGFIRNVKQGQMTDRSIAVIVQYRGDKTLHHYFTDPACRARLSADVAKVIKREVEQYEMHKKYYSIITAIEELDKHAREDG